MPRIIPAGLAMSQVVLLAACSVNFTVGKGPPPIHGDPSFGSVVLATRIDETTKEPLERVDSFDTSAKAIYATIQVKNVRAGAEFRFQWKKGGADAGAIVMSTQVDVADSWVAAWIIPNGPVEPGNDWSLDVLYNGKVVASREFSVTGAPPST